MKLSTVDLFSLSQIAIDAAKEAGEMISLHANDAHDVQNKLAGENLASQVVTKIDLQAQAIIVNRLLPSCKQYDLALLTEESEDNRQRFICDAFWCVDPLDGTLPFIESCPGYSVSIALVTKSGTPLLGVVYDPLTKTLYSAIKGQGIQLNGKAWNIETKINKTSKYLTLVCDRGLVTEDDYPQVFLHCEKVAQQFGLAGVRTINNGGAVMNACWVLENPPSCYFKRPKLQQGGGSLWDFAATTCLFNEMSMVATDYDGQVLDLNRKDSTFMNHRGVMFATNSELVNSLVKGLKKLK